MKIIMKIDMKICTNYMIDINYMKICKLYENMYQLYENMYQLYENTIKTYLT